MKLRISFLSLALLLIGSILSYSQIDPIVYVTRTGSKYHTAGCSYLKSSMPMRLSEASKRYSPCSRCNPPIMSSAETTIPVASSQKMVSDSTAVHSSEKVVGKTATGKTIYEGPRGGHYHYSKSGKRIYERKKK